MNFTRLLTVSGVAILLMSSCASGVDSGRNRVSQNKEELDPFSFGDEFFLRNREPVRTTPSREESGTEPLTPLTAGPAGGTTPRPPVTRQNDSSYGYRVQIGLFENREQMEAMEKKARAQLDEQIYVEYEAPFYRIRVGNFTSREEAERYVRFLKDNGYRDARWVMSKITVQ